MSRFERRPADCPFRRSADGGGEDRANCSLVERVLGDLARTPCFVGRVECEACCRHPLPAGPRLNPVVASLVFAAAGSNGSQGQLELREQIALHQVRQFATRWLSHTGHPEFSPAASSPWSCQGADQADFFGSRPAAAPSRGRGQRLRIGLVGPDSGFGLGHQNRDIAVHLGLDRWLVPGVAGPGRLLAGGPAYRVDLVSRELSRLELEAWLDGLDVVLFVESPVFQNLPAVARQNGVRVVCVPNWEWLHPGLAWLEHVDGMLCPTRHTRDLLEVWKARFGFGWKIDCVPWPVNTARFRYRRRTVCQRFVYVNGSGGMRGLRPDGTPSDFRRKGLEVLLAAARQVPEIPLIVYARAEEIPEPPPNIDLRPLPGENTLLYCDGDVCVLPSHWEGLGLPLLECQAAGLPLITTAAPPMNEHQPWAEIPVCQLQAVHLIPDLRVPAAIIQPDDLARVLRAAHGCRIAAASRQARRFVQREHSWAVAGPKILSALSHCRRLGLRPDPDTVGWVSDPTLTLNTIPG